MKSEELNVCAKRGNRLVQNFMQRKGIKIKSFVRKKSIPLQRVPSKKRAVLNELDSLNKVTKR